MISDVGKVRIVQPPIGEAPIWVRQAWVGLELPLAGNANEFFSFGVLSGPKSWISMIWGLLCGRGQRITGYPVHAGAAVDLLARTNPDAADWWRDNAPYMLRPGRTFLFNEDACSLLAGHSPVEAR